METTKIKEGGKNQNQNIKEGASLTPKMGNLPYQGVWGFSLATDALEINTVNQQLTKDKRISSNILA